METSGTVPDVANTPGPDSAAAAGGPALEVGAFLAQVQAGAPQDLLPVFQADLSARWHRGQRVLVEPYLGHPGLAGNEEAMLDLIYSEFLLRRQLGDNPPVEEYSRRFPKFGERLRRLLFLDQALFPTSGGAHAPSQGEQGDTRPVEAVRPPPPGEGPPRHPLPAAIGKYRVLARLGGGAQGEVYRAVHPLIGKDVVLKIAPREASLSPADAAGLVAEGCALAGLSHPGLARVYDLDFHERRPFLVLEHVRGRALDQVAREAPFSPRRAARLVAQVARALAEAHRGGLVHRDLKPANILLGDDGRPCVIDFGLARLAQAWAPPAEGAGNICGTVSFMPAEQAQGRSEQADARSDIFGLGAVLYYLLTGQAPFDSPTPVEALRKARAGAWPRERLRAAGVPGSLRAICARALAVEPSGRHARAEDLAADLEAFARRPRRWLGAAAGATALVLVTGLALHWLSGGAPPGEEPPTRAGLSPAPAGARALPAAPTLRVNVWRGRRYRPLLEAVPLRSGARLEVHAELPADMHGGLFLLTGWGKWAEIAQWPPAPAPRRVRYPAAADEAVPLTGPAGTELVLLCGRRSGPVSLEDLRPLGPGPDPWPALPEVSVLRLWPARVRVDQRGRDFGTPVRRRNPEGEVLALLETLRQRLLGQLDYFEGVAFAHPK
jgi:hypothetical protein